MRRSVWSIPGLLLVVLLASCRTTTVPPASPTPPSPTSALAVSATSSPLATPTTAPPTATSLPPSPTATPAPQVVYIANTDGEGANLRRTPGPAGERMGILPEGTALTPTGQQQEIDGRPWLEVRDQSGATGWVAGDFLSQAPPPPATPTAVAVPATPTAAPTRTAVVPYIPTVTPGPRAPVGPRPTPTLIPVAPAAAPTRPPRLIAPVPTVLPPVPSPQATRSTTPAPAGPVLPGPTLVYPGNGGGPTPCRDGTVSNSSGQGTCSGHGGIAR